VNHRLTVAVVEHESIGILREARTLLLVACPKHWLIELECRVRPDYGALRGAPLDPFRKFRFNLLRYFSGRHTIESGLIQILRGASQCAGLPRPAVQAS